MSEHIIIYISISICFIVIIFKILIFIIPYRNYRCYFIMIIRIITYYIKLNIIFSFNIIKFFC